ncbi:MAG: hypothetical protein IJL17_02640, partial [Kiritimatiellae bacterium]|nr:hypothetical protein [Kiritimatiellia bacterium]
FGQLPLKLGTAAIVLSGNDATIFERIHLFSPSPHIIPNGITPCGIKILKLSPRLNGVEGVSAAEKAAMQFLKVVVEVQ